MTTRIKHLAQPKTNFLILPDRETPEWKVSMSALKALPSERVCLLALPRQPAPDYTRESPEWKVSMPALKAHPSERVCFLAAPRQATHGWQPDRPLLPTLTMGVRCMAKASPRICELAHPKRTRMEPIPSFDTTYLKLGGVQPSSRIELLATPKLDHPQYRPDRPVLLPVPKSVLHAVASDRLEELSRPKPHKSLSEGFDPYKVSAAALAASASPRLEELSQPPTRRCRTKSAQD